MSERPTIWVARPIFDDVVERLRAHAQVRVGTHWHAYAPEELAAALREVDGAVIGLGERIDARTLQGAARLRIVANLGVGHNNLDLDALTAAGVVATNTPDVLTETTADHAWALLMAAARRVGEGERMVRAGAWRESRFDLLLGHDLHGRKLGILGMGRIGQAVARRAAGFGMPVLYHNRSRLPETVERACNARYVDKDALLADSDHLVLVLPYTAQSRHAIGAAELARMRPNAVLVNIARGGIVDDAALAAALREGVIAAAGLDVFEGEPALDPALLACDNAVLTPHIGSATLDTRRAMAHLAVDNVLAAFGHGPHPGRPPQALNPQAWP